MSMGCSPPYEESVPKRRRLGGGEKDDLNIAAGRTEGMEPERRGRGAEVGKMLAEDGAGFSFEQSV